MIATCIVEHDLIMPHKISETDICPKKRNDFNLNKVGWMSTDKSILTRAKRFRTCPPARLRFDPGHAAAYAAHCRVCPYCSEADSDGIAPWERLSDGIVALAGDIEGDPQTPPRPGDIRYLRRALAQWRDDLFYDVPKVMVLQFVGPGDQRAKVAQTYHDTALAAPGDLVLSPEAAEGAPLLIECWNTYPVLLTDLGAKTGTVTPEVVDAVSRMAKHPEDTPEWASPFQPMVGEDIRIYFRWLETMVAQVFARDIWKTAPKPSFKNADLDELIAAIHQMAADAYWDDPPDTVEVALGTLRRADLPMAASTDPDASLPVNLFIMEKGHLKAFRTIEARDLFTEPLQGRLAISGRIVGIPTASVVSELVCYLATPEKGRKPALAKDWDGVAGYFYTEFDAAASDGGRLSLAVVCETEADG